MALTRHTNPILRKSALTTLITSMTVQSQVSQLLHFPFTTLANDVDVVLSSLCQKTLNIANGPPYHKILYSWRISRGDFRGAASALWDRLQRLRNSSSSSHEADDETLAQAYLLLINTLSCVDPEQAWILVDQRESVSGGAGVAKGKAAAGAVKRRIVTLEGVRREYAEELDRIAAMETGRFAFAGGGGTMDVL